MLVDDLALVLGGVDIGLYLDVLTRSSVFIIDDLFLEIFDQFVSLSEDSSSLCFKVDVFSIISQTDYMVLMTIHRL